MNIGIANAKTYEFTLATPAKVGSDTLKPGNYEVKVDGSTATISGSGHRKPVRVQVKIEQGSEKFSKTGIETTNKDGADTIQAITLEGSNTRIVIMP